VALPDESRDRPAQAEPSTVGSKPAAAAFEPEPVALPDEAGDRPARFEPEPATVAANHSAATAAAPASSATGIVPAGDGRRPPPRRWPEQGQVVPLRPRATTRLKATGELLVLVAFLGLVVSSVIVALAVAGNQVLSGL
jgi:hypothetical protein